MFKLSMLGYILSGKALITQITRAWMLFEMGE